MNAKATTYNWMGIKSCFRIQGLFWRKNFPENIFSQTSQSGSKLLWGVVLTKEKPVKLKEENAWHYLYKMYLVGRSIWLNWNVYVNLRRSCRSSQEKQSAKHVDLERVWVREIHKDMGWRKKLSRCHVLKITVSRWARNFESEEVVRAPN